MGYDGSEESRAGKGGRTINLGKEVSLASTSVGTEIHISFIPPDPETIIYDGTSTTTEADITLETKTGTRRKIQINSFGLIKVLN